MNDGLFEDYAGTFLAFKYDIIDVICAFIWYIYW